METVGFRHMSEGTREDYELLDRMESAFTANLPERILQALEQLEHGLSGYQVSRLTHCLQAATRAEADGADEEMVLAALVHDIGDGLAPANHSQLAAAMLRPYVRPEVTWVVEHHGLFQLYYYGHHIGADPNARDKYRSHRWFNSCAYFCEHYDQPAFDPDYPSQPLLHFDPLVRRIFSRTPFDLA